MRITQKMVSMNMQRQLQQNYSKLDKVQTQISTGKRVLKASDDPIATAKILHLKSVKNSIEQYQRNTDDASSELKMTDDLLAKKSKIFDRAKDLIVQAGSDTYSFKDLEVISKEINELKKEFINTANSRFAGRSILGGFKTTDNVLNDNGEYIHDYKNTDKRDYNIGQGENISVNIVASEVLGNSIGKDFSDVTAGDKAYGYSLLEEFQTALLANDRTAISNLTNEIEDYKNNILNKRAEVGAKENRLELVKNRLETNFVNISELLSNNEDVDIAGAMVDFKNAETVYQASLMTSSKILNMSLIDFLG